VVCDTATGRELPKRIRGIVFPIVAGASLLELKQYEQFLAAAGEEEA